MFADLFNGQALSAKVTLVYFTVEFLRDFFRTPDRCIEIVRHTRT